MEDILISPVPSRVLQSFINSEPDDSDQDVVFPSTPPFSRNNLNALVTLPRGTRPCTSPLPPSISEESETPTSSTFSRKSAVKKNSFDYGKNEGKGHNAFKKSISVPGIVVPSSYNPKQPLVKHPVTIKKTVDGQTEPTNKRHSVAFTRTKSINAAIGPLTKEVCGKLKISWEDSDPCVSLSTTEVNTLLHTVLKISN